MEQFLIIDTLNINDTTTGEFSLDIEDIKLLTKMKGIITFTQMNEYQLKVINNKKMLTIPYYYNNIDFPQENNISEHILTIPENWLLDTLNKLSPFISTSSDVNSIFQMFHFNFLQKRVEACNSYYMGLRKLKYEEILETNNNENNICLHSKCVPVLKKVINNKSNNQLYMYTNDKYIKIQNNSFTYIIKKCKDKYINIQNFFTTNYIYKIKVSKDEVKNIAEYNSVLNVKNDKPLPMMLQYSNGKLYSYMKTNKYEVLDNIKMIENNLNKEMFISINPKYLLNIFQAIDIDEPTCLIANNISPILINGDEFSFLLCPIRIDDKLKESCLKKINDITDAQE